MYIKLIWKKWKILKYVICFSTFAHNTDSNWVRNDKIIRLTFINNIIWYEFKAYLI